MKRYLPILIIGFVFAGTACAEETLSVSVIYPAPLTVQITAPANVVAIATDGFSGIPMGGCTYSIDWGDGQTAPETPFQGPPHCTSKLTHTYAAPGDYVLKVGTYDIGPADGPENQRYGTAKVHIQ